MKIQRGEMESGYIQRFGFGDPLPCEIHMVAKHFLISDREISILQLNMNYLATSLLNHPFVIQFSDGKDCPVGDSFA